MWRVISTDAYSTIYSIDSDADVPNLPVQPKARQGDMAILCESADGSGLGRPYYTLNSQGQWVK